MLILTLGSIIFISIFISFIFYIQFDIEVKDQLKKKTFLLESNLNLIEDKVSYINSLNLPDSDIRLSLISSSGIVLYDNTADISKLENHLVRKEVKEAIETGKGESKRFSRTLGKDTYYYAVKLNNEDILRVSKTINSIFNIFVERIPFIILIMLIIFSIIQIVAIRLTKKIIEPINKFDFKSKSMVYEELHPFINTIIFQNQKIQEQFINLENRTITLKTIIENMKEGLILLDKKANIVSSNKSALSLFGISEKYDGENIKNIISDDKIVNNAYLSIRGKSINDILEISSKCYNTIFSPIHGSGALILFLDITEKMQSELIRREFSSNVSHELKTPLTIISGMAEMINSGIVKSEDIKDFSYSIIAESKRLLHLIDNIIKLSELDEVNKTKEYEKINIVSLIEEIFESLSKSVDKLSLNLNIEAIGDEILIYANFQLIYEMLFNVLENAIKYNRPNGKVYTKVFKHENKIKIYISDTGIGIPNEHLERIFERFFRVDKSHSKKIGGTGLGLSIVKNIVEYHKGTIEVTSKEGVGSNFIIMLPDNVQYNENCKEKNYRVKELERNL